MERYNNIVCVSKPELTEGVPGAADIKSRQIMSEPAYKLYVHRAPHVRVRMGKGKGSPALLSIELLRDDLRAAVVAKYGDPERLAKRGGLMGVYVQDVKAAEYFSGYILPTGEKLKPKHVQEYTANASMLNAIAALVGNRALLRRAMGDTIRGLWLELASEVKELKATYRHNLPENHRRLKAKWERYVAEGYDSLVNNGFGNRNRAKVTDLVEKMVLSLYCLPEKPYVSVVLDMYLQFLGGSLDVFSYDTGELFNRSDFYDEAGLPIIISDTTAWNIINNPKNRAIVDRLRNDQHWFNHRVRPHHLRHAPVYAFSKISLDDRDLPRKMADGNKVKAYYAYDVCSGAIIGCAYSRSKDKDLFIDCMRDMFRFVEKNDLGIPLEVEVEHHIVNLFKENLMKAGEVFPMVRWCAPGNSQEKYAEQMNRVKKYGHEKRYQQGIGRFYARLEANRPKQQKIFDEDNNHYKERVYSFDELVADDRHTVVLYNNDLHHDQKKYKGMTRLEVLFENLNPAVARYDKAYLAQFIGERVETSIKRNFAVTVQYNEYVLSDPQLLRRLEPNNYRVEAFYIPTGNEEEAGIPEVYLYQKGRFFTTCRMVETYSRAGAEWTDADRSAKDRQAAYIQAFDDMTRERKTEKVGIIRAEDREVIRRAEAKTVPSFIEEEAGDFDVSRYSKENMVRRAVSSV